MITAGHRLPDIEHYTLDQIELYQKHAHAGRLEAARLALVVARGAQAKKKDYLQLSKELENVGKNHDATGY
ncbi:hypothetical protein [Pseudomonas denitrificans (nom. rej.)]|uniref:Uncharacterized protein n=1 Tax=Pseudomonas denitrificans TaxID=43306 RepID=A0A9X7N3W2_PSEDE|nr:hypothetical protein [Pseudomonas denitrificans (nom. rej.)]QEY73220.1 hypothetical protein F1C79_17290 [Pseudomonas denitrificans (nom. rej.)]